MGMTHARSRHESHLRRLYVKGRVLEPLHAAGMVVVHMRDHDIAYRRWIDAHHQEAFRRVPEYGATPQSTFVFGVAGIDQDQPVAGPEKPKEIVHVVGARMIIVQDEGILTRAGITIRVFDRIGFPELIHRHSLFAQAQVIRQSRYSISTTSISSGPVGVRTFTTSPSRDFSRARAIGETQLTSPSSRRASSTPTMRIVFSSPRWFS